MDLGLSGFRCGDSWLAHGLNARWAQFEVNVFRPIPEAFWAAVDEAWHCGCKPVLNAMGHVRDDLAPIVSEHSDPASWLVAVDVYVDNLLAILAREERIKDIEVWGASELPCIIGGKGPQFDGSTIQQHVYGRVKEAHNDVRVWSGGYGINADTMYIQFGLCERAPEGFDLCNMHPIPEPGPDIATTQAVYENCLKSARSMLNSRCKEQPLTASMFGVPTIATRPPPEHNTGKYYRYPGNIRAIPWDEACEWYTAILDQLEAHEFETACLIAHDKLTHGGYQVWYDGCGLLDGHGEQKGFTDALCTWAQGRETYAIPDNEADQVDDSE